MATRSTTASRASSRRTRATVFALVIGLVAILLVGANDIVLVDGYPRLDSYRVVDARTIRVAVAVAPNSWTRVTRVTETATAVRVTIESVDWPLPLPGTGVLVLRDLIVPLVADLGDRVVEDARGGAVPMR